MIGLLLNMLTFKQPTSSLWDELSPAVFTVFTVLSIDNFDMLQSYTAVNCGNQHHSYHVSTIVGRNI